MTQADPLVAVVTPVYNGGKYLDETMACVQAQTYPNLVHVVLDNASTDATPEIIRRHQGGRAPIITQRNPHTLPIVENWNAAAALAPAEAAYLRMICADDVMAHESIAKMVALGERHPSVGLVGCHLDKGRGVEPQPWPTDREVFAGREVLARVLRGEIMVIATHMLIRRSMIDPGEPLYRPGLLAFDTQACLRILTRGDWGYVHEHLAYSRVHEASMTSRVQAPTEIQFYDWLHLLREFGPIAFQNDYDAVMRRYLRHYRRRMLRWRATGRGEVSAHHAAKLSELGERPGVGDYIEAVADWAACKLGFGKAWAGYPF